MQKLPKQNSLFANKNINKRRSLVAVLRVIERHLEELIVGNHSTHISSEHSRQEHIQDILQHIQQHVHLPNLLRLKGMILGLTGLKIFLAKTLVFKLLVAAGGFLKLVAVKVLFTKYALLVLAFLGMSPQLALVSDLSDECLSEAVYAECMAQEDAVQETCLSLAIDPTCQQAAETEIVADVVEEMIEEDTSETGETIGTGDAGVMEEVESDIGVAIDTGVVLT